MQESYNTSDDPSGRVCILNKMENVNINVFNIIARINEQKTLIKTCFMRM